MVPLQGEKASLDLQVEELRAEIALLQVKLRRQDHLGDTGSMSGVGSTPPTSVWGLVFRDPIGAQRSNVNLFTIRHSFHSVCYAGPCVVL